MAFTHLHVHTEYSLLDGAARIKDLVARAKELGMTSLAITDHGAMFGVIDFYRECLKNDIKPVIGCEVYTAARGMLNKDTVVATIMSNSGLIESLEKVGINYVATTVGDRFVYECMQEHDYAIGGEPTGHIILKKYATTGDGLLTAIMLAEEICDSKTSLAKLAEPITFYPQYQQNVRVKDKAAVLKDSEVRKVQEEVEQLINGKGRALLRQSGTEPVIRVMVESETQEKCVEYVEMIVKAIAQGGHCIE